MNTQRSEETYEWDYPLHMLGSITTLPTEDQRDIVDMLHTVVEEVTGKPVYRPEKPRIGFLP